MGFAIIMFVVLLIASLVIATVVTYGIAKDSQIAPLKAENIYAGIKTDQAQTGLTIVNTCLSGNDRYTTGQGSNTISGPYTLYLNVSNNGSIVLNSTKATVFYNNSFTTFTLTSGNVWTPMNNASMQVSNIYIPTPGSPDPYTALRLLVVAENGVSAIAPTTPTNFNTIFDKITNIYIFSWNASMDKMGIDHYLIYTFPTSAPITCPINPSYTQWVAGNQTNVSFINPCTSCKTTFFFMTAVDLGGNMAIQSRTLRCTGASGKCNY